MDQYQQLEKRISIIEERNNRVEKEKAWETSNTRKLAIAAITYISLATYFEFILKVNPWINAIVPTIGFLLSTLSLSIIKKIWVDKRSKKT
ncbi:MAG: hypothetical protein WCP17_03260 [bacterium]